jgi:transcriptional regulator with XRE-family HTH domain
MDINKAINKFLYDNRMNHAELARRSGITFCTISLIRNNHRAPSLSTMKSLASAFDVKLSEFIAAGE